MWVIRKNKDWEKRYAYISRTGCLHIQGKKSSGIICIDFNNLPYINYLLDFKIFDNYLINDRYFLYKFQFQIKNKSEGTDNSSAERTKIETEKVHW